jgi:hypothetical protein
MQIRLEITDVEIRELLRVYAEKRPKPRLPFEDWAGREIASHFSKARSQKAEWAVQETLRPVFTQEIQRRLQEMLSVPQTPEVVQIGAPETHDNTAALNTCGGSGDDEEDQFLKVLFTVEALVPDFEEVTEAGLLGEEACVASGPHQYDRRVGGVYGEITEVTIQGPFKGLCPGVVKLSLE